MWEIIQELDLLDFLDEMDVNYETSGKNIGAGWVAVNPCPFCGDDRNHFGIEMSKKRINCWICGKDGTIIKFLMKYFDTSKEDALSMIKEHIEETELTQDADIESLVHKTFTKEVRKIEENKKMLRVKLLPGDPITEEMVGERPKLRAFITSRKIPVGMFKYYAFRYDYRRSMRVIMPIHCPEGKSIIAYQGRDITGKAMLPYITLPKDAPIGETLFGIKAYRKRKPEVVIIVEGILDCLRLSYLIHKHWDSDRQKPLVLACFRNKPTQEARFEYAGQ
jgi:DNA primase